MNNQLIPTNGLWYKIKKFFKNLFFKEKSYDVNENVETSKMKKDNDYTLKEKFEIEKNKKDLAEKLLYGEIGVSELNDSEVDEMTEYFTKDIQNIDNELFKIKQHILAMKQELQQ